MNPTMPAARWQPANSNARRPLMGLNDLPKLNVSVRKDGQPLAGAEFEVMFADGSTKKGATDINGIATVEYTSSQIGQAVVLLTPPDGVQDLGEDNAQGVNLQGGEAKAVAFELTSAPSSGNPVIGLGIVAAIYGLALS